MVEDAPSTLQQNPYSWSGVSNMLYIEAPACVGYSYADTLDGCQHDDASQAVDNLAALQIFYAGFPELRAKQLFITGESYVRCVYDQPRGCVLILRTPPPHAFQRRRPPPSWQAGIYVPTLAKAVVLSNAAGTAPHINLAGIAVGNGCLGSEAGLCSFSAGVEINTNMPYYRGHGLISSTTWEAINADCPMGTDPASLSAACNADINEAHNEVGNVNIYNVRRRAPRAARWKSLHRPHDPPPFHRSTARARRAPPSPRTRACSCPCAAVGRMSASTKQLQPTSALPPLPLRCT